MLSQRVDEDEVWILDRKILWRLQTVQLEVLWKRMVIRQHRLWFKTAHLKSGLLPRILSDGNLLNRHSSIRGVPAWL